MFKLNQTQPYLYDSISDCDVNVYTFRESNSPMFIERISSPKRKESFLPNISKFFPWKYESHVEPLLSRKANRKSKELFPPVKL